VKAARRFEPPPPAEALKIFHCRAVSTDAHGRLVVPVVRDELQQVQVGSGDRVEEVTADRGEAIAEAESFSSHDAS